MDKFAIEIENWGEWELEKDFSNYNRALQYGLDNLIESSWRIVDRITGNVLYSHTASLESVAQDEINRFRETERWRTILSRRPNMATRQQQRMSEIARSQRQRRHEQNRARNERLRGFGFVGEGPPILYQDETPFIYINEWGDVFGNEKQDKVNWKEEGF